MASTQIERYSDVPLVAMWTARKPGFSIAVKSFVGSTPCLHKDNAKMLLPEPRQQGGDMEVSAIVALKIPADNQSGGVGVWIEQRGGSLKAPANVIAFDPMSS